mmetsp:Transcript_10345/g.16238  ORF Transcript_10345/g.16238 Transcript_10345/m.16238 type:complete len:97 (-) Transcript_10345:398-688(-)
MGTMSQNQLFQKQKCTFMGHALAHLYQRPPRSLSKFGLALDALLISDNKYNRERLLKNCTLLDLFLDCKPDFQSHRVGFRPDPSCIDQSHTLTIVL